MSDPANPWLALPPAPQYYLPVDGPTLDRFATQAGLRFEVIPVPYLGDPARADVVLLSLNPGFSDANIIEMDDAEYVAERRASLRFASRVPFVSLDPAFRHTGGYRYWSQRLGPLINRVGLEVVQRSVACVEFFPYASATFRQLPVPVPSQWFGFALVRTAIEHGKLIVVLRGEGLWALVVPRLAETDYITVRSVRASSISPKNVGAEAFERIVDRLKRTGP